MSSFVYLYSLYVHMVKLYLSVFERLLSVFNVNCMHQGSESNAISIICVMITYNIYIVIRETGQFSSKGIINDFIGNLNRLTVSRRFTEQAV